MITPAYSPTATERVLPRLALDFTTGVLDPRVTVTRALNTATCVGSNGYIQIANANLPRFDYNPSTLEPRGLLIEESRANVLTYSNDFNNGVYTKTNCSIVAGGKSPDGTNNTNVLVENTSAGNHWFFASNSVTGSYTLSVYAKPGSRNWLVMRMTLGTGNAICFFNVSTGTIGTTASGLTASIQSAGNGFYRCSISGTIAVGAVVIGAASADGVASYTGDGSNALNLYGAQLEAGAFATSYIPTTTTSLTRNSDVVEMTGTNFSSWFNQTEGTFAVWFDTIAAGGPFNIWALSAADATPSGRYMIGGNPANLRGFVSAGGSTQADMFSGTIANNTQKKAVLAYKTDSFAFSTGGLAPTTDALGTLPTPTRMWIGQYNGTYLYGHVAQLLYWPQRLINAETSAFSK